MAKRSSTKQKIVLALFELMKTHSVDEVTVSDICKQASVSRMSYYRSFKSKQQILEYQFDEVFQEFFSYLQVMNTHDMTAFLDAFFTVIRRHRGTVNILIKADLVGIILDKLQFYITDLVDKDVLKIRDRASKMWIAFVAGGLTQMIVEWDKDDMVESNAEMVMIGRKFLR
ncbi:MULTISPECIES: TetR/AcrR family transcriptional regulator [Pediococcus]|jgi:AcrR family transcriptional regulator|uniref:Transcriptional regulator n=1 Tax=Pediococcus parvulus TaxID=54062 RepID=A0A176TKQ3_9LACO|nr:MULTISPECIES: TetR/AcrR family transcriptional regulator [Pediococcus]MCT3026540.1 TetR/AcrR family transcriptional regulator [Pediococcus parvulus]MCT3029059.1 TetR/AcrR family transcriptional regulator [Pediococcus parvulus]MCT3031705.1 TetR/AcrR family transcriptional regulator [Pediococcus parvulus]MCT3035812.1 TetR/AcrR family transcriptional regulator [Pediococcus parvulus]MDN5575701.1 TetR/AcrR family transcriptional regulator [Pediococcus sp.]